MILARLGGPLWPEAGSQQPAPRSDMGARASDLARKVAMRAQLVH